MPVLMQARGDASTDMCQSGGHQSLGGGVSWVDSTGGERVERRQAKAGT